MILRRAVGVGPALGCDTRIKTSPTLRFAHRITGTLLVHPAAHRSLASCGEWVSRRCRRTLALEASDDVDADRTDAARPVGVDGEVGRALVDVPTARLWVSCAARVTLALWARRSDGTCGILATLYPGTRVLARFSFQDVRRLALTLSVSAFFVGGAVRVSTTPNSNRGASLTGVPSVPRGTQALVGSLRVTALRVCSARRPLTDLFAFVDVSTKSSCFERESLGADAEAVARAGEDAFLIFRAWIGRRTVPTDQDAVLSLPHERVLAAAHPLLVAVLEAHGVSGALVVPLALDLLWVADDVGVAHMPVGALAQVAAFQVHAERIQAARRAALDLGALVDVSASSNRSVVCESPLADALTASIHRDAVLVCWAWPCRRTAMDDLLFFRKASSVGIPLEAVWAHTLELPRQVSAEGSVSTGLVGRALVNVNAAR